MLKKKILFISILSLVMCFVFAGVIIAEEPEGNVVWATASPIDEVEATIDIFNEIYPNVRVDAIYGGVGELANRIEGEAADPQIDVWSGGGHTYREALSHLVRSYESVHDDQFPENMKAEDRTWYAQFTPPQIFMVNTNIISEEDMPQTWADLADPKYEGEIVFANPGLSSSAFNQMQLMVAAGGWDLVRDIIDNAVVVSSSRLTWQGVANGEYGICMVTENSAYIVQHDGYPVEILYPEDGVNEILTVVSLIENSPNQRNAELLLDVINSVEVHELLAGPPHFRRSARPDVELHESMVPTSELNFALTLEEQNVTTEERDELLQRFDEIFAETQ